MAPFGDPLRDSLWSSFGPHFGAHFGPVMMENGDPNLTVLGKLRTKKGEKELRRQREDEGERIEESSEKMRRSAPRKVRETE